MTDLTVWMERLYEDVSWQKIPVVMTPEEEMRMLSRCLAKGIEFMFIAVGKGAAFDPSWLIYDAVGVLSACTQDLNLDELTYAYTRAEIEFFKQVQTDVNNIVGYTTDALTVTNADKPYQNLAQTIDRLEKDLRQIFYTMIRHAYL